MQILAWSEQEVLLCMQKCIVGVAAFHVAICNSNCDSECALMDQRKKKTALSITAFFPKEVDKVVKCENYTMSYMCTVI